MRRRITRRDFVRTGTAAGVAAATATRGAFGRAPAVVPSGAAQPVVISSANGNWFKNGGSQTCVEKAYSLMMAGTDVLDALIEGVNIVELDPEDYSVGYGGVPNADGVVQLDSSCMHGPLKRAGGVASLEGVQDALARRARGHEPDRPSPPRRQGRAELRAQHGVHDRGGSQHAALAQALARVEAADGPRALPDAEVARDRVSERRRSASGWRTRRAGRWRRRDFSRRPRCTARSTATGSTRRARSAA